MTTYIVLAGVVAGIFALNRYLHIRTKKLEQAIRSMKV